MSALKRRKDTFYHDMPSSKRSAGANQTPLGTLFNAQTHFPPTPLSNSRIKEERFSTVAKQPEPTNEKEGGEEEEPESQLPASEREQIRQDLSEKYDALMLAYTQKSFEAETLEGKLKNMEALLASSQEQLELVGKSRQELMNELQAKHQKSIQTEQRLRSERDQMKKDLATVRVEKNAAISERDAAQKATSQFKEELQDYEQLFALQSKLLHQEKYPQPREPRDTPKSPGFPEILKDFQRFSKQLRQA
ncbi:hypothetical protein F5880DRAFT_1617795 [Lentinula raphanica]|nr:hypothetical protein F5880DRAFT_1617795 [Lentinula raphanica]